MTLTALTIALVLFFCCFTFTSSFFHHARPLFVGRQRAIPHTWTSSAPLRVTQMPSDENDMTLDELKAELELRGVDFSDCVSKKELSDRLKQSRKSGKADPKILDQFNQNFDPSLLENDQKRAEIFDNAVLEDVSGKDGKLPGGLPPEMMKSLASDPEIMRMLQDAKMQDIMRTMMMGGPEAMKKYLSDPDAVMMLDRLSKAMERVTSGKQQ
jgi:hypothetical protein